MRVTVNFDVEIDNLYKLDKRERDLYYGIRSGARIGDEQFVYGMFFVGNRVLYLVALGENERLMTIADSRFYRITENSCSRFWKIWKIESHVNIIYFDVKFVDFLFCGIDRFVSEPEFFELYHTGHEEAIAHVADMMAKIRDDDVGP